MLPQILFEKPFLHGRNIKPGLELIKCATEIGNYFFTGCNSSSDIQPLLVQMFLLTVITVFFSLRSIVFDVICAKVGSF